MKDYSTLYQHYRTIAYERANPESLEDAARQLEPTFGKLLPADLNACILDVGCGMGQFLFYLKKKGYRNIMGVDLSPEQVDYCRQFVLPEVRLTDDLVSFLSERPAHWNCIVMKDVIEHLPRNDIVPVLASIFEALRGEGLLLVETGNMASATGLYLRYIDFTHECGFTENSLRQVLRSVGFTDIQISGESTVIYSWRTRLFVLAQRLWRWRLQLVYRLERGLGGGPKILSKLLIVRARKSSPWGK